MKLFQRYLQKMRLKVVAENIYLKVRVEELEAEAKACVEYDAALIDKITEERDGWHRAASAFQAAMDQVYAAKTLIDCHIIAQGILCPDIKTTAE